MVRELRDLVEEVRFDGETRVLILRSAVPGAFCAGADLKERKTMSELEVARFLYNLRRLLSELESLPIPTIAAIDGPALGGGLELALACDLRVAAPSVTKIGLPETRLAIIPGAGGTQRLARLIGTSRAKDLIFTAKVMTAEEAHGQGPLALRAAKTAVDVGSQLDLGSGLDVERLCYQTILKSRDRLEGLAAFAEKRKPVYRGE
ncbi:SPOSA6832_00849 [Sporobolomyces salmonicolor]|uniref:SPOSA6832_00849-mRNA-1:cds n=1 Tax=Sporidiobolus salmonicolor TaxID=5005 RepID=A0A0D6EH41_SPOSA|nr:SPOSA6832_00849 [Sporobolomyces salmonicolor]